MKLKKVLFVPLMALTMFGAVACTGNSNAGSSSNVTYQVTLDANDSCKVQRIDANTDTIATYSDGWVFKQYGNVCFELSKDGKVVTYSNSRYGYQISINP